MAPEIAAIYVAGTIPAGLFSSFHYYRRKARNQSAEIIQLQNNLIKVDQFWVDLNGSIEDFHPQLPAQQSRALKKTFLTAGLATVATSWLGLGFHLLIFISLERIAVSRFETRIFNSDLVKKELSKDEIQSLLQQVRTL